MKIADMPIDERPSSRVSRHGVTSLADSELLAIVLSNGTRERSALEVARTLLTDGLPALARRDWTAYLHSVGIGVAKATRIAAAFELGRRAVSQASPDRNPVRDPTTLARSLVARYSHHVQERVGAIYLDAKSRIIREREVYVGTLNSATVSTRDILRFALDDHAAAIIVFHNHPSGDPNPSSEDLVFTKRLVEAGQLLGIDLLDHLILGVNRYVSLKGINAM